MRMVDGSAREFFHSVPYAPQDYPGRWGRGREGGKARTRRPERREGGRGGGRGGGRDAHQGWPSSPRAACVPLPPSLCLVLSSNA
jgi:hypothetical protein